ncbi:hypothetical protein I4U23_025461 [Adineta vaga]|nr:hypothetical protein I4U23_025461 [Adineta vaga]
MFEDTMSYSISMMKIPLISSTPQLTVSSNHIFADENTKKRKQFILFDKDFQKTSIPCFIDGNIIDCLWYDDIQKVFLLTSTTIFIYNLKTQLIKPILDIKPTDNKPLKCFTRVNNQSTLLIAYDEWESKFIERWEQQISEEENDDHSHWKLIKNYSVDLTLNEFIGSILSRENNIAITIYNHLTEQWRMELRDLENFKCLKQILLPEINLKNDYRMIHLEKPISTINWLIYSPSSTKIIAIDFNWKKKYYQYKLPIYRIEQFRQDNIVLRTINRVDIYTIT